ncbi:uncharacterized protein BO87DRAFT_94244 [Aspergillus neoniger CBS 115656]|uniref:Secreted protein n=1 Tax=Aspergillus neoniger (strain CBS 115656) TaxID=1448310 RepID=A0A318YHB4_ASPNB|nr:hypothetical protein BO87DRAFT_94244 [Aspergillus neoniger CBS 115656]PYH33137.1 hypothetical protein BO87DRAFT_94244 [Aspergillus neoniger CBS 115656]
MPMQRFLRFPGAARFLSSVVLLTRSYAIWHMPIQPGCKCKCKNGMRLMPSKSIFIPISIAVAKSSTNQLPYVGTGLSKSKELLLQDRAA